MMNTRTAIIVSVAALGLTGCLDNINAITELNQPPVAVAVAEADGESGDRIQLPAPEAGGTVTVELDGTDSYDNDGTIEGYDWRSAVVISQDCPEEDLPRPDPWDGSKATVELPQGVHAFLLWVTDDGGMVSRSDTVIIAVGEDLPPEGEEKAAVITDEDAGICPVNAESCMADTADVSITDECRACTCEACPVEASACDDACWGLVNCVAMDCGGNSGDIACIMANCGEFLGGASGAIAITGCALGCAADCM